jgi:hypothetical protein
VIQVDTRALFDKGRVVAQRHAPKVPAGDLPALAPFDWVRGLDASLWWDSVTKSLLLVSEMSLGTLGV